MTGIVQTLSRMTDTAVREWVSIEDPEEERTWVFDVAFLLSGWECIFGRGCKGVLDHDATELVEGCCSHGAHLTDTDDIDRVQEYAQRLTPDQWQMRKEGLARGILRRQGKETLTRRVKGACVFLNRPGFEGGPGCALHRAALEIGDRPLNWKPEVCWQLPLRREDTVASDGHVTSTVTQWDRKHWGEGGDEFHWWCTESPEAFIGKSPVYVTMREELVAMSNEIVYLELAAYLDKVRRRRGMNRALPHPAVAAGPEGNGRPVKLTQTRKARSPGQRPADVVRQS